MYSVSTDDELEAKKMMSKVFKIRADDDSGKSLSEAVDLQYDFIKKFSSMDSSTTTFGEAVCGSYYRKATWVCFTINIFNSMCGINGIMVYVNRLLVQMKEQSSGEFPIDPVTGGFLIGLTLAITGYFPMFYAQRVGRKSIYIFGHLVMALSLLSVGICLNQENGLGAFISICTFTIGY